VRTHAQKILAVVLPLLLMLRAANGEEAAWTIVLHSGDFVIGDALKNLKTRHTWAPGFDESWGAFDVALRKNAAAVPAPRCRMDYLILRIPTYYPENPKKASVAERRAVYDALVVLQARGSGGLSARVEAPVPIGQMRGARIELTACNLYFALPLSVKAAPQ
jgi:hypothetical protein